MYIAIGALLITIAVTGLVFVGAAVYITNKELELVTRERKKMETDQLLDRKKLPINLEKR